jgi:hypothetical protein
MVRPYGCVRAPASAAGGAQKDVDGVAEPCSGGMATQPVEILGIARGDLAERPALVPAEVKPQVGAIGTEGPSWRAMGGVVAGRRRGSAPAIGLPDAAQGRVADDRPRPVEIGHSRLRGLAEGDSGVGMELAGEDAVGGAHDVRIGVRLDLEDPVRVSTIDHGP